VSTADTRDRWRENEPAARLSRQLLKRQANGPDPSSAYDLALARGIDGEREIGRSLERRLVGTGAVVVHSTRFLKRGDIDHVLIGPNGVTVVDAKNWSGQVTASNGVLRVGSRAKTGEVEKLGRQCDAVRLALLHARPELRNATVRGVICLAGDGLRAREDLRGGFVLCGSDAAGEIALSPGELTAREILELRDVLLDRIPRVKKAELDELHAGAVEAPTKRSRRAVPRRYRSSRWRTGRWFVTRALSALLAIATVIGAYEAVTHLRLASPSTPRRVSQLSFGRHHGRAVVKFAAPAAADVKFTLVEGARRYSVRARADGVEEFWVLPRRWEGTARLTVHACVTNGRGHCVTSATTARRR
jgi:hypothetical protein